MINLKGRWLKFGSNSPPIIGSDFGADITSQCCELGPIIGPIILSYMGSDRREIETGYTLKLTILYVGTMKK